MSKRARLGRRWRRACGVPVAAVQHAMRLLVTCSRAYPEPSEDDGSASRMDILAENGDEDLEEMHWRKSEVVRVDDTAVSTMH